MADPDALFTGALLLQCPDDPKRQFGMVAGTQGAGEDTGVVEVHLRRSPAGVQVEVDGDTLVIRLGEAQARALARTVDEASVKLQHLRELRGLGRLNTGTVERKDRGGGS